MVFEAVFGADFVALIDFAPLLRKATRLRVLICTARRRLCESNRIYLRTFQRLGLEGYGPHRKLTVFFSVETGDEMIGHSFIISTYYKVATVIERSGKFIISIL